MKITQYSKSIKEAVACDEFFALLSPWQCGAFDGGCLMVAVALKEIFKGELYGIKGQLERVKTNGSRLTRSGFQHAIVKIGNLYLDGDGVSNLTQLINRWEGQGVKNMQVIPAKREEMLQTPMDEEVVKKLVKLFRGYID